MFANCGAFPVIVAIKVGMLLLIPLAGSNPRFGLSLIHE